MPVVPSDEIDGDKLLPIACNYCRSQWTNVCSVIAERLWEESASLHGDGPNIQMEKDEVVQKLTRLKVLYGK